MQGDRSSSGCCASNLRDRKRAADARSGALKQIEEWATEGRQQQVECGRNAGKLSDNVTEDRLLKTRIWELSKERYKFLSQKEYEKRTFLDRQLRKTALFRELMKNMESKKTGESGREMRRAIERRTSCRSHAQSVQDRDLDPSPPHQRRCSATKVVPPRKASLKMAPISRHYPGSETGSSLFQTEPSYPIKPRSNNFQNPCPAIGLASDTLSRKPRRGSMNESPTQARKISFAVEKNSRKCRSSFSWHGIGASHLDLKPTQDPRYQLLEHCLCENWTQKDGLLLPEVSVVIQNNTSLYLPPKKGRDSKASTALKFQRLMSEQGLVF